MFCPQCGKEVKEGAAFCSNCGNKMGQGGTAANTAPQAPASNYQQPQQPVAQDFNQAPVQGGYNQPQDGAYNGYQQNGYQQNQYAQGGTGPMDPNWIGEPPFMDSIKLAVTKKYVEFNGRATAKEYWYFIIMNFALVFVAFFIGGIIGDDIGSSILGWIVILGLALPGWGICVRRLHDAGHSGWWVLLTGNMIGMIVLGILKTQPFANQYGPVPVYDPNTKQHFYKF